MGLQILLVGFDSRCSLLGVCKFMNRKSNWEKYVEIRQTVREFRDKKKAPLNVFEKHREITKKKDEDIRLGISRPSYDELKP